jgi:hypothetical protein
VANLTAKALRNAHRFERVQERRGDGAELRQREREQAALIGFMRRLLAVYPPPAPSDEEEIAAADSPELGRLVGVAQAVLNQEALSR